MSGFPSRNGAGEKSDEHDDNHERYNIAGGKLK